MLPVKEAGTTIAVATQNACKACMPLGACLAYRGVEGAVPFLHGPQGCATYMRRFLIGHFREPMDIACSSFSEETAIFGGSADIHTGLDNVAKAYHPAMIGIATTCLAETIGEDMGLMLHQHAEKNADKASPLVVAASTPSYSGTHADGFHAATCALVNALAETDAAQAGRADVVCFPNMVSPADLRYLKEVLADFGLCHVLLPDYSETLDRPIAGEYERIPKGGVPISAIRGAGAARASVTLGSAFRPGQHPGAALLAKCGVPSLSVGLPVGIRGSDLLFQQLEDLAGKPTPEKHAAERGRLIDTYVDAHKYLYGKRAVVYGEEDLVTGIASFLDEIGVVPVVCASGGRSGGMAEALSATVSMQRGDIQVLEDADFVEIGEAAEAAKADLLIGNSRGFGLSRRLDIPLIRVGMPVHDRIGAQRIQLLGYRGAQALCDRIANAVIARDQERSEPGYMTM